MTRHREIPETQEFRCRNSPPLLCFHPSGNPPEDSPSEICDECYPEIVEDFEV